MTAAAAAAELPTVCVIGAGLSGLTASKALKDRGIPFECFEMSDRVGGNWAYGNPNGKSSAYRSLHIDTPKQLLQFEDLPMPDDWPDFLHHTRVFEYLNRYADTFGLREHIRFETAVDHVERLPEGGYRVTVDGEERHFDAVIVGNGHHWDPRLPDPPFPGDFEGESLHAHHYIDPSDPIECSGKRVLVVGIGNTAADIASELSHPGVTEKTFLSTRSGAWVVPLVMFGKPLAYLVKTAPGIPLKLQRRLSHLIMTKLVGNPEDLGLPRPNHRFLEAHPTTSNDLLWRLQTGDLTAKPNISRFDGRTVAFEDGTSEEIDVIIYATGYKVTFPFLDEDFISAPENRLPLFKRVFKPGLPDLAFVGLAQAIPTLFPFVEAQSKWVAEYFAGDYRLPDPTEMERTIERDERALTRHYTDRPRHTMQADYYVYVRDLDKERAAGRQRAGVLLSGSPA